MNTQKINLRIEELETQIEQTENRKSRADTRQQEANDQRDIDNMRAQIEELIEKIKMNDIKIEEYESSDGVATREFKRLRNIIRTHCVTMPEKQEEIKSLKAQVENLEGKAVFLEHQLNNAIAEIKRRPKR